jgi:hypothetical protein
MNSLDQLLTIPTLCLIVVLAVLTLLLRKLAEAIWPTLSAKTPTTIAERVWEEFVLPAVPALMGAAFCAIAGPNLYPYPAVAAVTPLSRVLYGFALGWFSSGGYRGISAVLKKKWNISLPGDTDPPPRINGTGGH